MREPAAGAGRETEIKFRTTREGLERTLASPLLDSPKPSRSQSLRTVYYDTPSLALRKAGLVLRLRKSGRAVPLLGLKTRRAETGNPFRRLEIEVPSPRGEADLALFDGTSAALLRKAMGDEELEAQFDIQTRRRTLLARHGASTIEVAVDEGMITAGARREALFEVEFELKSGDDGDLLAYAMLLARDLPLALDFVSKGEKGFQLVSGEAAEAVKAAAIDIDPDAGLDIAIGAILSNTLTHFTANWAPLRMRDDADAVHQSRVALRRMRSALKMFASVLPQPPCEKLRGEAKRIASVLGLAREIDVFRASLEQVPASARALPLDGVLATVEERRQMGYREARSLIDGKAASDFVLGVQAFLAEPGWRNRLAAIPARDFASKALTRLHRRVLKRGCGFPAIPDGERHELRIALKNLRYAVEFLGSMFGRKGKRKAYAGAVSDLQELLGAHNDEVTAKRLLASPPFGEEPAAQFLLGWYSRGARGGDKRLRKAWKKFRQAEPFWK